MGISLHNLDLKTVICQPKLSALSLALKGQRTIRNLTVQSKTKSETTILYKFSFLLKLLFRHWNDGMDICVLRINCTTNSRIQTPSKRWTVSSHRNLFNESRHSKSKELTFLYFWCTRPNESCRDQMSTIRHINN